MFGITARHARRLGPAIVGHADGVQRRYGGLTAVDVAHLEIQRGVITSLNGRYHRVALNTFMVIVLAHWGGGGPRNVLAIWAEFGPILEKLLGKKIDVARADWRPGDQKVFYADYRKAKRELGYHPRPLREGWGETLLHEMKLLSKNQS